MRWSVLAVWMSPSSAHTASHNCAHKSGALARAKQPHPCTRCISAAPRESTRAFSRKSKHARRQCKQSYSGFRNAFVRKQFGQRPLAPLSLLLHILCTLGRAARCIHPLASADNAGGYGRSTAFRTNSRARWCRRPFVTLASFAVRLCTLTERTYCLYAFHTRPHLGDMNLQIVLLYVQSPWTKCCLNKPYELQFLDDFRLAC